MKIAIISLHHVESSLCLAKYIAQTGHEVDYYFMSSWISKFNSPGVVIYNQKRHKGVYKLSSKEIPEILGYTKGLSINFYTISLFHFREQFNIINKLFLKSAVGTIKSRRYDAIDIVGQAYGINLLHELLRNENLIHTLHEIGSHYDNTYQDNLVDNIIKDSGKVILHSSSLQKRLSKIDKDNKVTTAVIPFGMFETTLLYEDDTNIDIEVDKNSITLLFYGYISPYKGLDVFEEACKLLVSRGLKFRVIIAGHGTNTSIEYFNNVSYANVINRFLTSNEIIKLHRISDAVVMPYKSASQSGIIPTSFMLGCPVIGTKVGAIPEVLTDGLNGLLCEPNNPQALAEIIERFINNKVLRNELSQGVALFGKGDKYDWSNIAEDSIKFFRQ